MEFSLFHVARQHRKTRDDPILFCWLQDSKQLGSLNKINIKVYYIHIFIDLRHNFSPTLKNVKFKAKFSSIVEVKKISNDLELIQSDPISCPQNQKGNN